MKASSPIFFAVWRSRRDDVSQFTSQNL